MSDDRNIAIGLFKRIESYYKEHGYKMKDKAAKLKGQFEALQLSAAIKCQQLSETSKSEILNFINDFSSHYSIFGTLKAVKTLTQDLISYDSHIKRFLKSLTHEQVYQPAVQGQHVTVQNRVREGSAPQERQDLGARYIDQEKEQLKEDYRRLQGELDRYKQQQRTRDSPRVSQLLMDHKHEVEQLKQHLAERDKHLSKYERQVSDLSHRLSSEMNKKISADESNLENISVPNRPMNISGEYQQVFTNEWTEAKKELDHDWQGVDEQARIKYLCDIVLEAYERCASIKDNCNVCVLEYKSNWIQPTSVAIKEMVFDIWKTRETKLEVPEHILQEVLQKVGTQRKAPFSLHLKPTVQTYVKTVFHLTWSMVIQKPPLTLDVSGVGEKWKGEKLQEPALGSKNPDNGRVGCYVYPTLMYKQQVMVRGKVLIL